ncbi:MAG: transporter substrate-binding domain-containing protein [Pseudobutyrivibrio sp.]|nr:transporter substrate-binding domain-containing protein [Pseudobutyrivibrio sp.]
MKKRIIAGFLTMVMAMSMVACGGSQNASTSENSDSAAAETTEATEAEATESDTAYIQEKGKLIVGITDFAPMDYKDDKGEWIGFDADMARKVAESMNVEVEFVEIDWDNKILELENKSIDVVWNGMTLTPEVTNAMACTNAYCNNAQVVVVKADVADDYKDVESLADLTFAVESGSAGEAAANDNGFNVVAVKSQADAVMEVAAGTSDACIIDLLMAGAMIGEGTSYPELAHTVELTTEEYGVGCRKGSDLADYINEQFKALYDDGTMAEIATKYGVQDAVVAQ